MNRRDVLKISAAVPAVAKAQHHFAQAAMPAKTGWKPQTLTAQQNGTVIALVDILIPATDTPGAKDAKVNEYIDLFLASAPQTEKDRFLNGLKALDEKGGKPFTQLTQAERVAVLEKLDEAKDPFFRMAKQLTSRIYYSTAVGFKELNKGGRVPATFGCKHPDHRA